MKNNKAFTLIELLAVIIILSIVVLISTPIVLNVIENARKSAGESEANMIMNSIISYCEQEKLGFVKTDYCKTTNQLMNNIDKIINLNNIKKENINLSVFNNELISFNIKIEKNDYGMLNGKMENYSNIPNLIDLLVKHYKKDNKLGLIKDGDSTIYYYKGSNNEVSNNFLWYGGHLWRVLEFDTDKRTLKLITQQPLTSIKPVSKIWSKVTYNQGDIIDGSAYDGNYIDKWLNEYFYNSLDDNIKKNILNTTYNIGVSGNISQITTEKKVGLLDELQYNRAGGHNSFLNIDKYLWLGNIRLSDVGFISANGYINITKNSSICGVRPVITISDINVYEGNGTEKQSYKIILNKDKNISVGDYINLSYNGTECGEDKKCLFRIVNKDETGIKIILNSILPNFSPYASDLKNELSNSDLIYNELNLFYDKINSNYIKNDNNFNVGDYNMDYKNVMTSKLNSKIGLPTVGEMFSSNDIDFYNQDVKYFWTMNRNSLSHVNTIAFDSRLYLNAPDKKLGVRPVLYLYKNLNIKSGDGSPNNPYELK